MSQRTTDHGPEYRHIDEMPWETLRFPGQQSKMVFHPLSLSTRRAPRITPAQPLGRSPKFMITCDSSTPGSGCRTAHCAVGR